MTTESRTVTKKLPFLLTEHELADKGREAAEAAATASRLKREFAAVRAEHKDELEQQQILIAAALAAIRSGTDEREVTCEEQRDYSAGTVSWWYDGVCMSERVLTQEERQLDFTAQAQAASHA